MKMNIVIFFDGNGCVSKTARKIGHNVFCTDILNLEHITYVTDIKDFDITKIPFGKIDFMWFSPPCEKFSMNTAIKGGGNRCFQIIYINGIEKVVPRFNFNIETKSKWLKYPDRVIREALEHMGYVRKCIDLIKMLNPTVWVIENPARGLMGKYLKEFISFYDNRTTYCQYGFPYRKETSIFSNVKFDLKWCKVGSDCHKDVFHQRYDKRRQNHKCLTNYLERSRIPEPLVIDILNQTFLRYI